MNNNVNSSTNNAHTDNNNFNSSLMISSDLDFITSDSNNVTSRNNIDGQVEVDSFGEKLCGITVAMGAQTVSDVLLQLRCKAMRKELDRENEVKNKIAQAIKEEKDEEWGGGEEGRVGEENIKNILTKYDVIHDNAQKLKESSIIQEILKEKMPPPSPDCNDTYSTSLDVVLSVLSVDGLLSSISAMGKPQVCAYKKEKEKDSNIGEKSNSDDVDGVKEVNK